MELIRRIEIPLFIQAVSEMSFELVLLIIIFSMLISIRQDRKHTFMKKITIPYTKEILIFYIAIFLYNLFNLVIIFCEGAVDSFSLIGIRIAVFGYFLTGAFLTTFFLQVIYMDIITSAGNRAVRKLIRFFQALELLLMILLIVTPFTGFLYHFDGANHYVRSFGYPVWFYVTLVTFGFIGTIILFWYRKADVFFRKVLLFSTLIPLSAFLLDHIIKEVSLNNIAVIVTALIIFILYERHKVMYAIDRSTRMDRIQTRLTLSQIQPHFLYNVLQSIMYHADKDPQKTRAALGDFSKYLRKNLDSLTTEHPVRFLDELEHTEKYLELEKLRFEDDLEVEYDIQDEAFELPVLTLQPLAENAIRHGIRKSKTSSGRITITSERTDTHHAVKVADNGAGFDTDGLEDLDDTHIGIRNVKKRLWFECRGELRIESEKGKGTVCTILIPRDGR
ncbi:MAG: histidine kinase [Lachnospiraceae bacterium]|nr:histidine kinase [Lachnospiraceae bacterium]